MVARDWCCVADYVTYVQPRSLLWSTEYELVQDFVGDDVIHY